MARKGIVPLRAIRLLCLILPNLAYVVAIVSKKKYNIA